MFDFKFEGNLAADAEFHFTPTGKAVTTLRVAHNTRRRNAQGEWSDGPTMWVRVTAWEKLAENATWMSAYREYSPARMNGAAFAVIGRPKPQTPRIPST